MRIKTAFVFVTFLLAMLIIVNSARAGNELFNLRAGNGSCDSKSFIKNNNKIIKFDCGSAVVGFFDKENNHVLIQFIGKKKLIGFAGYMEPDGVTVKVKRFYSNIFPEIAKKSETEGDCKFFFFGPEGDLSLDGLVCGTPYGIINFHVTAGSELR